MAVCYVFSFTIICGHFAFNEEAFTAQNQKSEVYCYAKDGSDVPTVITDPEASNVAELFQRCIEMGFYVHLLGILGDASFAARVYIKKNKCFRMFALIACSLYSLLWLAWLIWLHVVVFNHDGRVCSGAYLPDD